MAEEQRTAIAEAGGDEEAAKKLRPTLWFKGAYTKGFREDFVRWAEEVSKALITSVNDIEGFEPDSAEEAAELIVNYLTIDGATGLLAAVLNYQRPDLSKSVVKGTVH